MSLEYIALLLEKAVENRRDLTVIINADGTTEVSFNIPQRLRSTWEPAPEPEAE